MLALEVVAGCAWAGPPLPLMRTAITQLARRNIIPYCSMVKKGFRAFLRRAMRWIRRACACLGTRKPRSERHLRGLQKCNVKPLYTTRVRVYFKSLFLG